MAYAHQPDGLYHRLPHPFERMPEARIALEPTGGLIWSEAAMPMPADAPNPIIAYELRKPHHGTRQELIDELGGPEEIVPIPR